MFIKKISFIFIIITFYQTSLYSKSTSFDNINKKYLSKYFSGIVASENKDNSTALVFFNSSKILINKHDPYLKKYVYSLVLENKVSQAINIITNNKDKNNSNFFDAHLLLILDSLKKNDLERAYSILNYTDNFTKKDRFTLAILESLKQYVYVFKEKKILNNKKNLGKLSVISETFQRCFLEDRNTDAYFLRLINDLEADYTRYIFFYLSYLIDSKKISDAQKIANDIKYINTTLLLSQAKNWIENGSS